MNYLRRKAINDVYFKLSDLRDELSSICDDEQEAYDNLPDPLQCSEKGDLLEQNVDDLESAVGSIEDALEFLDDVVTR